MAAGLAGTFALTVHGPDGVVDLVVPDEAVAWDVAKEYAAQCGLASVPSLHTSLGRSLAPGDVLADHGVRSGELLVATGVVAPPVRRRRTVSVVVRDPAALSALWVGLAAGVAVLAAWAGTAADGATRTLVVVLLGAGALVGVVPVGRYTRRRTVVAPAFGAAAAFVALWAPTSARLPTIIGVAGLTAAVIAAIGRMLDGRIEEALRVWILGGILVFTVAFAAALAGWSPQVVWAVLLVGSVLAGRLVPAYAVDVPDSYLIDLERLAVSAWSARERPGSRRTRTVVPPAAVADVAARGARLLTAAAWAVLVIGVPSAFLLLRTATLPIDRTGARIVVLLGGLSLMLTARSYRYAAPRWLLRAAGLGCVLAGLVAVLPLLDGHGRAVLVVAAVVVGLAVVVAAVATGRGWRSAWWASKADLAEALAGAGCVGVLVVAIGVFRAVWESGLGV